jgi:hypothetical protein
VAGRFPPAYMAAVFSGQAVGGIFASGTNVVVLALGASPSDVRYTGSERTIERQVKVLIKFFGYFLSISQQGVFCRPISFKIQLLESSPQKQKVQRQKQLGADKLLTTQIWRLKIGRLFFLMLFPVNFVVILCNI